MWWHFVRRAYFTLLPLLLLAAALGTGSVRSDIALAVGAVLVALVVAPFEIRASRRDRTAGQPVQDNYS
jgi:hypothetical protein